MRIGQLSQSAGVPVDTIRYYESQGILPAPLRQVSGYRRYDDRDLARLRFVRRAKALGFSLREIHELLALSQQHGDDMAGVRATAAEKLADIERRQAELQRIRDGLQALLSECPGHGTLDRCPILAALSREDT